MINLIDELVDSGHGQTLRKRRMNVHIVEDCVEMGKLSASSKMNTDWAFLCHLRDVGRAAADRWIAQNFESIGARSTVDLKQMFAGLLPDKKHVPKDN